MGGATGTVCGDDWSDDNVSVTSTINEEVDPDEDWSVNRVLGEMVLDGEKMYLIEWSGYPLDEANWEPESNLNEGVLTQWQADQAQQRASSTPRFRVGEWKAAVRAKLRGKYARHNARNRKRRRLGLEETVKDISLEEMLEDLEPYPSDADDPDDGHSRKKQSSAVIAHRGSSTADSVLQTTKSPQTGNTTSLSRFPSARQPSGDSTTVPSRRKSNDTRKGSLPMPRKASLASSTQSEEPRRKFVGPVATASSSHKGLPVNIFAGGKVPKQRKTLLSNATSGSAQGGRILKLRQQRLINQGLRDMEGTRDPRAHMRPKSSDSNAQQNNNNNNNGHSVMADIVMAEAASEDPHHGQVGKPPENGTSASLDTSAKKSIPRKKSVRFSDDAQMVDPVSQVSEDSLFVPDSNEQQKTGEQYSAAQNQVPTRSVSKSVQLGFDASRKVNWTFDGIPEEENISWTSSFAEALVLSFTHTCTAQDFKAQDHAGFIQQMHLAGGAITSSTKGSELLANLAARLRLGSFGLLSHSQSYCVLLFPSRCNDWKTDATAAESTDSHLRYGIFQPAMGLGLQGLPAANSDSNGENRPFRSVDMAKLFGPEYGQLLPSALGTTCRPNFFLAFPKYADVEEQLVTEWLGKHNSVCNIMSSVVPGAWSSFVQLKQGTMIIHEDMISITRRFPAMSTLLRCSGDVLNFWTLTRTQNLKTIAEVVEDGTPGFGDIQLHRVLESKSAVLFTPSLVVSQPQKAYKLFKRLYARFRTSKDPSSRGTIVVGGAADDWLSDLALKGLYDDRAQTQGAWGPRSADLECLLKMAILVRDDLDEAINDDMRCLTFAPSVVDANDEQSLVNWFGWWSIQNLAHFRRFVVVGSSEADSHEMSARIPIPQYGSAIVNEVDEAAKPWETARTSDQNSWPLQLLQNDEGRTIKFHLMAVEDRIREQPWCPLILYRLPVSYWTPDMAHHFRDFTNANFESFNNWFSYLVPFRNDGSGPKRASLKLNSYAGFFYTTSGKWDPQEYPFGMKPKRHPWIAIFRPSNPHIRPWKGTELLIWDLSSPEKFPPGRDVYEGDLDESQQKLIQLVDAEATRKSPGMPLIKVWLGGFEPLQTDFSNPLDITLQYLDRFINELKFRAPAPENKLPERGWKAVTNGKAPQASPDPRHRPDTSEGEDFDSLRVICHPPRGRSMQQRSSKCRNRLHLEAKAAKARGERRRFRYTFRPTMAWYGEQLAEGRGFEHISVVSLEDMFEQYGVEGGHE